MHASFFAKIFPRLPIEKSFDLLPRDFLLMTKHSPFYSTSVVKSIIATDKGCTVISFTLRWQVCKLASV